MNEDPIIQDVTPADAPQLPVVEVTQPPEVEEKPKAKASKQKAVETVSKEKYDALASAARTVLAQYKSNHRTFNYPGMAELNSLLDS